jgi:chromosome partitioning protein
MSANILAVAHPGGGVGKSTTALNLAFSLAVRGRRVVVVDIDPGGELSDRIAVAPAAPTLADVLASGRGTSAVAPAYWETAQGVIGFDMVSAGLDTMIGMELTLNGVTHAKEHRLRLALAGLRPDYDYILIDCPPNLTTLALNAFYAADSLLVPVQAHPKAYRQLSKFWDTIREVNSYRSTPLTVLGLVITMLDRRQSVQREVEATLRGAEVKDTEGLSQPNPYAALMFQTVIPQRAAALEDSYWQAPAAVYTPDPHNGLAGAYASLAEEVIARAR